MQFNSIEFLIFFAVLFFLFFAFSKNSCRKIIILCANIYFYSCWDFRFLALILAQTISEFFLGRASLYTIDNRVRKFILIFSITMNIVILIYFKYLNWFIESLTNFIEPNIPNTSFIKIALPLGISFYTFRILSYSIDIYKKNINSEYTLLDFAIYVSFFPIIISGPIARASDILPQINNLKITKDNFIYGARLFIIGLFLKIFIADHTAMFVNFFYENHSVFNTASSWIAATAYSLQIYADFAGYSSMAIGVAWMLGIQLNDNFNYPYLSVNVKEFWKKWHISLSTWIRDYIYIPLGGNKKGRLRTYINLCFTMTLCGLWHGAGLNFIFWGFLHGTYLIGHNLYVKNRNKKNMGSGSGIFLTYFFVTIAWIFFRAETFQKALMIIKQLFIWQNGVSWHPPFIIFVIISAILINCMKKLKMNMVELPINSKYTLFILLCLLWLTIVFYPKEFQPFVYAQF